MRHAQRLLIILFCFTVPAQAQAVAAKHRSIAGQVLRVASFPARACWANKEECSQDFLVMASMMADDWTTWNAKKRCWPNCVDRTLGRDFSETHLFLGDAGLYGGLFIGLNRLGHTKWIQSDPTGRYVGHVYWIFTGAIVVDKSMAAVDNSGVGGHGHIQGLLDPAAGLIRK